MARRPSASRRLLGDKDFFIPMEAWIDEEGRPARMTMSIDAGGESMSMTADILEYGVPVDVQAPAEVRDDVRGRSSRS